MWLDVRPRLVTGAVTLTLLVPALAAPQAPEALPPLACAQVNAAPLTSGSLLRDVARTVFLRDPALAAPLHVDRRSDALRDAACSTADATPLETVIADVLQVRLLPVTQGTWYNSGYAEDRNNGMVWAGRGLSTSVAFGAAMRWGPLTAAFVPEVAWQQNRDFEIVPREIAGFSPYIHAHYRDIDLPQRFGPDPYASFDPFGQSFVRVDAYGVSAGWSHEPFRIGPALRNPLLMSGSAGGFHHYFIGTDRPLDLWIARLELELAVGHTSESEWFDDDDANDRSEFAMWSVGLAPRWLHGLTIGVTRVYHYRTQNPDDVSWFGSANHLRQFFLPSRANLGGNQLASAYARWILPEAGVEIWGEWGRDDTFADWTNDFLPEPDHSQAYTLGFQKVTRVGRDAVRVQAELTALQENDDRTPKRAGQNWYRHHEVIQGYTHEGQMLGAGIGPGADAQFVAVDYLRDTWLAGAFVERVRRNDASAAAVRERLTLDGDRDVALTGGVRAQAFLGAFSLGGTFSWTRRLARDFLDDESNVQLVTELTWWPGRSAAQ
ncbi:MAG TPA: hypothetical protein VF039_07610 [Longimicrobiales bacterium]